MIGVRAAGGAVAAVDVPDPEGDGALVEIAGAGICGSDFHIMGLGTRVTLGHEFAGTVDGRPVAVEPFVHCHACGPCRAGRTALCEPGTQALHGIHRDGGMAEAVLVDPSCLVELPPDLLLGDACLAEPIAVGLHAVHRGGIEPGMRVVVVGGGMVGLVAAAMARRAGADVDLVARHAFQYAAAERLGVGTDAGRRYDLAIEAAGSGSALADAVARTAAGGRVVFSGSYWEPVELPGFALQLGEIDLVPSVYYGHHDGEREFEEAARVLGELPELASTLITHRFPLSEATRAFEVAADRDEGAIRVVLEPRG
ncbi:MAG: alcohol dehydrogenase catalytic domain-containing protein [Actinomycetota bacterium]